MHRTVSVTDSIATRGRRWMGLLPLAAAVLLVGAFVLQRANRASAQPATPRGDEVCASCHREIYASYEKTTMAHASGAALDGLIPGTFHHRESDITYRVYEQNGRAWLSFDRASASRPLHGVRELRYYIGSGHRGRTYLFEEQGYWFEAPINYYGKKQLWDMAPAYGQAESMPLTLAVDSNCLSCHASRVMPAVDGVRNKYAGAPFQAGGVTCASCHGDTRSHVEAESKHAGVGSIVNPARLTADKRDSVCLQCHLEGDAAIYLTGRSLAGFKPGEDLQQSVAYYVNADRKAFGRRASSEYEALLTSGCKRGARDRLTCTSCHDPHSSPAAGEEVAFYRGKCLACHAGETFASRHHPEQQNCAACHMPTRETKDISHEELTDHSIPRVARRLSDRSEDDRSGVSLEPVGRFGGTDRELGLAYAQTARHGDRAAGEKALGYLQEVEKAGRADGDVDEQIGFLDQAFERRSDAVRQDEAALRARPTDALAMTNLAVIFAGNGQIRPALGLLSEAVQINPTETNAAMDLAFIECSIGDVARAHAILAQSQGFDPDNPVLRKFIRDGVYGGRKCPSAPALH